MQEIRTHFFIIVYLYPRSQTEESQHLWLYLQRDVEVSDDVIDAKRYACPSPEHHHGRLETSGIVPSIIDYDLRNELVLISQTACTRTTFCQRGATYQNFFHVKYDLQLRELGGHT